MSTPTSVRDGGPVLRDRAPDDDPQRHRGHQQRGRAGGDVLLGQDHEAVAAEEQERADERGRGELAARDAQGRGAAADREEGGEDQAGEGEAERRGGERRDGFDGVADARGRWSPRRSRRWRGLPPPGMPCVIVAVAARAPVPSFERSVLGGDRHTPDPSTPLTICSQPAGLRGQRQGPLGCEWPLARFESLGSGRDGSGRDGIGQVRPSRIGGSGVSPARAAGRRAGRRSTRCRPRAGPGRSGPPAGSRRRWRASSGRGARSATRRRRGTRRG